MKILIKCDEDNLALTNEGLENDNYVAMEINNEEGSEVFITMPVEELFSAIKAFYDMRT